MHIIIVECCGGGGGLVVDGGSIRGYFVVGLHWWLFQRSYHDPLVITLLVMHFFYMFCNQLSTRAVPKPEQMHFYFHAFFVWALPKVNKLFKIMLF